MVYCISCFTLRSFTHAESSKLIWRGTWPNCLFLQATFHLMLWQWRHHHSRSKWPFEAPHHSLLEPHSTWVDSTGGTARFPAFLAQRKVQRSGKPPAEAALGIIKAPLRSACPQIQAMLSHAESCCSLHFSNGNERQRHRVTTSKVKPSLDAVGWSVWTRESLH